MKKNTLINDLNAVRKNQKVFIQEVIKIEKSDAELLSDCILLKLQEIGQTERQHSKHLKESFFEEKKRLLALHSRVCSLLDE